MPAAQSPVRNAGKGTNNDRGRMAVNRPAQGPVVPDPVRLVPDRHGLLDEWGVEARMTYFHGQGGHCNRHFKKPSWNATAVQEDTSRADEAAARNLSNRVNSELPAGGERSDSGPSHSLSLLFYPHLAIRHWTDCLNLYWHFNRALLRAATAI
jgi:hypothetical protein